MEHSEGEYARPSSAAKDVRRGVDARRRACAVPALHASKRLRYSMVRAVLKATLWRGVTGLLSSETLAAGSYASARLQSF